MTIWEVLQIKQTTDKKEIKKAYAKLLKIYHPEDDPENFKAIQEAYQKALAYANKNQIQEKLESLSADSIEKTRNDTFEKSNIHSHDEIIVEEKETHEKVDIHVDEEWSSHENTLFKKRNKELFLEEEGKQDVIFEDYIIKNIISRLGKKVSYSSLVDLFKDPMVHVYLKDAKFKQELDKELKKKKYTGTYEEFRMMAELLEMKGLEKAYKKVDNLYKMYFSVASPMKKNQFIATILIAFFSITLSSFMMDITGGDEPKELQGEIVKDELYEANKKFLNGYYFLDDGIYYTFVDSKDRVIKEEILLVKYTDSPYLVLVQNEKNILFNTQTNKEKILPYDNVFVFNQRNTDKKYLACEKEETWYLCEIDGNEQAIIQGSIKGANCIDFIEGVPTFAVE